MSLSCNRKRYGEDLSRPTLGIQLCFRSSAANQNRQQQSTHHPRGTLHTLLLDARAIRLLALRPLRGTSLIPPVDRMACGQEWQSRVKICKCQESETPGELPSKTKGIVPANGSRSHRRR